MRLAGSDFAGRNAKRLRRAMTPPEIELWLALRRNDDWLRFRRQYAAGDYVLDFFCAPARLAIESTARLMSAVIVRRATHDGTLGCVSAAWRCFGFRRATH